VELPEDLAKLLEMIKAHIKEKGGLSSPSIDRETWEEIDALVKAIKSMNLPYGLKDIADELGVSYSSFTKYYKAYQKMIEGSEQGREQPKVELRTILLLLFFCLLGSLLRLFVGGGFRVQISPYLRMGTNRPVPLCQC